jgi:hypothetical protein
LYVVIPHYFDRAIIRASSLPMSIIIVGVGQEDFSAMEALDADKVPLSANGQVIH